MTLTIEAPEPGMSDVERLMLAVFIILTITALLVVMIMAAKMSDMQTRLDVLEDQATPSFAQEHAEPEVEEEIGAPTQDMPVVEPEPKPEPEPPPKARPRPSPAPRTDTEPKTVAIEQWQVDLDRQYEEAMSAITEPPEDKK